MPIDTRVPYRLALALGVSTAVAYGSGFTLPYFAPLLTYMLMSAGNPPPGLKGLIAVVLLLSVTLGMGLILGPILRYYPLAGLALVVVGLLVANLLALAKGKALIGTLMTVGVALVSAAAQYSDALATAMVGAMIQGVVTAVLVAMLAWAVCPSRCAGPVATEQVDPLVQTYSLRATLMLIPPYLLVLINPGFYTPVMMKSAQMALMPDVGTGKKTASVFLSATFLGGLLALIGWFGLKLYPSLWMFALWLALLGATAGHFLINAARGPKGNDVREFWNNTVITSVILLGPAVQDSAQGKDVYQGFLIRGALFLLVAVYGMFVLRAIAAFRKPGTNLTGSGHVA